MNEEKIMEKVKSVEVGCRKLGNDLLSIDEPTEYFYMNEPPRLGIHNVDDENLCSDATMEHEEKIIDKVKSFGVGRRKLHDDLFSKDKPPPRLGIYDVDDETLCHDVIKTACQIPGCKFIADTLLEFENHYNASHRYSCSQCKKMLPSPHLLDLHIQEKHDSFFAVMAAKKPSFCCYIEECKEKFLNSDERLEHCVKIHKLPKDFRFDQKPNTKIKKSKVKKKIHYDRMELDSKPKCFTLTNNKQKGFSKYSGKKFTKDVKGSSSQDVNMDEIMDELKNSLLE